MLTKLGLVSSDEVGEIAQSTQYVRQDGDCINQIQQQMSLMLQASPSQPPTQIGELSTGCILWTPLGSSLELALTSAYPVQRQQQ